MAAHDILRNLIQEKYYRDDTFTLDQAYELAEAPLEEIYPKNKHIRDQIRRLLQKLRDDSFLDFVDRGLYRVVGNRARLRPPMASYRPVEMLSEEIEDSELEETELVEGGVSKITINTYERNPKARAECIEKYGCQCSICGFDYEKHYGQFGKGYIPVHHLVPLSTLTKLYVVNPVTDLIPACANCHAIIHRKRPPFTPDEVKEMLTKSRKA
jgi:hypothetical protein